MMTNRAVLEQPIETLTNTYRLNIEQKENRNYLLLKRWGDIIISLIGLVIASPIFLLISLAIKSNSNGKTIYRHKRIGKNGRIIELYKFRTMVADSHDLRKYFSPKQLKQYYEEYKVDDDPRITRIGRFLRKTSLDELPQLINILKGEMSLIGPRPVVEEELEKYGIFKHKFLSITPGLTGFWQANGRSNTTYEQRMKMELHYVDNVSVKLDLAIFFKTFISVLKKEGAV